MLAHPRRPLRTLPSRSPDKAAMVPTEDGEERARVFFEPLLLPPQLRDGGVVGWRVGESCPRVPLSELPPSPLRDGTRRQPRRPRHYAARRTARFQGVVRALSRSLYRFDRTACFAFDRTHNRKGLAEADASRESFPRPGNQTTLATISKRVLKNTDLSPLETSIG